MTLSLLFTLSSWTMEITLLLLSTVPDRKFFQWNGEDGIMIVHPQFDGTNPPPTVELSGITAEGNSGAGIHVDGRVEASLQVVVVSGNEEGVRLDSSTANFDGAYIGNTGSGLVVNGAISMEGGGPTNRMGGESWA